MANRRMFAKTVIETDKFMGMPISTQCLYFHLLLQGDDEGFVANPRQIMRHVGGIGGRYENPDCQGICHCL